MKIGVYTFHESKEPKDMENEIKKLKKQLEIAKRGLNFIVAQSYGKDMWDCAKGTLKQIEELDK